MRILVAILVVLAGCASPPGLEKTVDPVDTGTVAPPPPPNSTLPPGTVLPLLTNFTFADCGGFAVAGTYTLAALDALLPDGYTASNVDGSGRVLWHAIECANFRAGNSVAEDTVVGSIDILIDDPGFGDDGVHMYRLGMLAKPDVMARLWPVAGYPTYNGTFAMSRIALPVDLGPAVWNITLGDYKVEGAATASASGPENRITAYTETEDGRVAWSGLHKEGTHTDLQGTYERAASDPLGSPEEVLLVAWQGASWNEVNLTLTI